MPMADRLSAAAPSLADFERLMARAFARLPPEVRRACADLGLEYAAVTTDQPLELVLFDFLKARERRGRRPGRRAAPGRGGRR